MKMNSDVERMLKNVVKSVSDTRPVLKCAHFENGNTYVTDSHRLIRVRNSVPKGINLDIDLSDFSFPDVNYPSVDRLIAKKFLTNIRVTKSFVKTALPAIKSMRPGYNAIIEIKVNEEHLSITRKSLDTGINQSLEIGVDYFEGEPLTLSCSPNYLSEALTSMVQFEDPSLQIGFNTPLQPFIITNSNVDYLLTPVRVF